MSINKNHKIFLTILIAVLIVLLCALGIIYLVRSINVNASNSEITTLGSGQNIKTISGNKSSASINPDAILDTKVNVKISDNSLIIENIGENYSYSIDTSPNQLVLNVSGRS